MRHILLKIQLNLKLGARKPFERTNMLQLLCWKTDLNIFFKSLKSIFQYGVKNTIHMF